MDKVRQRFLILSVFCLLTASLFAGSQKFFPDDPLLKLPPPKSVGNVHDRNTDDNADFIFQSMKPKPRPPVPAGEVNTLGEVPDSQWFTNRHAQHRLTPDELQRGPGNTNAPVAPFRVIGGKSEGITPGFRMRDAAGRLYFVKVDPRSNPEMATTADVIVSKFVWAIGYNAPENYITQATIGDFVLAGDATINGINGRKRQMTWGDFKEIVDRIPKYSDGSFRVMASLSVEGKSIGPFRYEGTRADDPNDVVLH